MFDYFQSAFDLCSQKVASAVTCPSIIITAHKLNDDFNGTAHDLEATGRTSNVLTKSKQKAKQWIEKVNLLVLLFFYFISFGYITKAPLFVCTIDLHKALELT